MTTLYRTQLQSTGVFDSLAIVTIDGFKPARNEVELEDGSVVLDDPIDPPGLANFFVEGYGSQPEGELDPDADGILWTDYDAGGYRFSVLIDAREVEAIREHAKANGYEVIRAEEVSEPLVYGDGHAGTVTILKHPDGWVIL